MAILAYAFRFYKFLYGEAYDLEIKRKANVVHIPDIELKFFRPGDSVAAIDLCPTSNAGLYLMTACLCSIVEWKVTDQQWTRTYQAHISLDDVY